MQLLDPTYQVLYSELAQRSLDAAFTSEFSLDGRFITMESRGRRYWYFDVAKLDGKPGSKRRTYVGPVDDPEVTRRVENFKDLKADHQARRKLVATLVREAYLPRPELMSGDIVQALSEAGFFRLRGVLVGTTAFQCYSAVLGVRLPGTIMQTGDTDFALFHSIATQVGDSMPPVLDTLRKVDPTFREIPHQSDGRHTTKYAARSGYRVEFLTPNTGSDDFSGKPTRMPALGTTAAEPLRFLDYLIYQPIRAVMLHGAGVPVLVPSPERYAIHKLIVANRRRTDNDGLGKNRKDVSQAVAIMQAMIQTRQREPLAEAYMEAWDRGEAWREAIRQSLNTLEPGILLGIRQSLSEALTNLQADAASYGLALP
jgi:hypothetical protein